MAVSDEIQSAIKSNKVVIGYNESISYIRLNSPRKVVVANNLPISLRQEIESNLRGKDKIEVLDGTSVDLGVLCGKPFPVSTLVIK